MADLVDGRNCGDDGVPWRYRYAHCFAHRTTSLRSQFSLNPTLFLLTRRFIQKQPLNSGKEPDTKGFDPPPNAQSPMPNPQQQLVQSLNIPRKATISNTNE